MRDVVAGLVAAALVFVALSLLTTLHFYRRRQQRVRQTEIDRGRTIIVELPTDPELTLFTEDAGHFYYGAQPIDSKTGKASKSGDITAEGTLASYGQTMLAAVGVAPADISKDVTKGTVITAALA